MAKARDFNINETPCYHHNHNKNAFSIRTLMQKLSWAYGVVVCMFDFHRSDRGSNPDCGGEKFPNVYDCTIERHP